MRRLHNYWDDNFCRRQDGKSDKSIAVVGYTKPKPNIVTILEHTSGNEEVKS